MEQALSCFKEALAAYGTDPTLPDVAAALINLGITYASRRTGDQRANLEEALNCYKKAQLIYGRDPLTPEYARLQLNMGSASHDVLRVSRGQIEEEALACYKRALQVFTLESFPRQHRDTQLNLAQIQGDRQNWQEAHTAYQGAMKAEGLLLAFGQGSKGTMLICKKVAIRLFNDGYVLTRLGRPGEAAVSLNVAAHED